MSLDDDLFNDPVNEEEMLNANEDEDDDDDDEDMGIKEENEEEQNGQEEEGEDDEDDDDDDDDDEDDEDDDDSKAKDDDDDIDADDSRFIDAKESQNDTDELQRTKEDLLDQFRDDLREDELREKQKQEDEAEKKAAMAEAGEDEDGEQAGEGRENGGEDKMEVENSEFTQADLSYREKLTLQAKSASKFDIVPTVAIPYASQCHAIAFSEGPRWIVTGGEDGFIRKYDFIASVEGKSPLTMGQRHNLVDTITKAGVIVSYWENEEPQLKQEILKNNPKLKNSDFAAGSANYEPKLSPVYALDVDRNGFWCLSGLSKGGIALYTMRYNEGYIHRYFMQGKRENNRQLASGHSDTISVLKLNQNEDKFLSGSWDKTIREWDLNTGKCSNLFLGSTGQLSNIQYRPFGLGDMTIAVDDDGENKNNETLTGTGSLAVGDGSDMDSLFGDSDADEEEKEESRIENEKSDKSSPVPIINKSTVKNKKYTNDSIFMSSSIDGTINIWDVRVNGANSVLRLGVPENTPPWCMSSTWSNCGEYIYAGRRNSTVEEFSIKMPHKSSSKSGTKGIRHPNVLKVLSFPKISGPISSISTMPNNDFLLCGSNDNIRLYNLGLYNGENSLATSGGNSKGKPATPFMIIPGHHGGILSALWLDDTGRFMVSASGNRGWGHSNYTETVLLYEIDFE